MHAQRQRHRETDVLAYFEIGIHRRGVVIVATRIVIPVVEIAGRLQTIGGGAKIKIESRPAGHGSPRRDRDLPAPVAVGQILNGSIEDDLFRRVEPDREDEALLALGVLPHATKRDLFVRVLEDVDTLAAWAAAALAAARRKAGSKRKRKASARLRPG